jgi:hypothetical protein
MAARPKLIADRTEHRTEPGGMSQALEPLQVPLALPDRLLRVLDAGVLAPFAEMAGITAALVAARSSSADR